MTLPFRSKKLFLCVKTRTGNFIINAFLFYIPRYLNVCNCVLQSLYKFFDTRGHGSIVAIVDISRINIRQRDKQAREVSREFSW